MPRQKNREKKDMTGFSKRLNAWLTEQGWPERARAGELAGLTGAGNQACWRWLSLDVMPRRERLLAMIAAVNPSLTEAEQARMATWLTRGESIDELTLTQVAMYHYLVALLKRGEPLPPADHIEKAVAYTVKNLKAKSELEPLELITDTLKMLGDD